MCAGAAVLVLSAPLDARAATSTSAPTTTSTAAPTTAAKQTTVAPTPTTIEYYKTVERDCADYEGDDQLADELKAARGNDGSGHLISLARYCGVIFTDGAETDKDLDRPLSNLEIAMTTKDDPLTNAYDDITENTAQAKLVTDASTAKWLEDHPAETETTVPAAEVVTATTAAETESTEAVTTTSTTLVGAGSGADGGGGGGGSTLQILGALLIGAGLVTWAVNGVRKSSENDADPGPVAPPEAS